MIINKGHYNLPRMTGNHFTLFQIFYQNKMQLKFGMVKILCNIFIINDLGFYIQK